MPCPNCCCERGCSCAANGLAPRHGVAMAVEVPAVGHAWSDPADEAKVKEAFPVGCEVEIAEDGLEVGPKGTRGEVLGYVRSPGRGSQWHIQVKWASGPWASGPWANMSSPAAWIANARFRVVGVAATKSSSSSAPRNNDGRGECFWCQVPTAKRGGGMYDVCPKCGR